MNRDDLSKANLDALDDYFNKIFDENIQTPVRDGSDSTDNTADENRSQSSDT
jgi:hypothetical protein